MNSLLRPALFIFLLLSVLTGIVYPLAITAFAQLFPSQANGSMIVRDGKTVGSKLIGQDFSGDPRYFWGRLSATAPVAYTSFNTATLTGSSGSNLGPTNPALVDNVRARVEALKAADVAAGYQRAIGKAIPVDLVTASGSGLDPGISIAGADYQIPRVAKARGLSESDVRALVAAHTSGRQMGVLGEPNVNVLGLNLALDSIKH